MAGGLVGAQLRSRARARELGMGKLLFMGVRGSADPTNAAMPFIMANGAVQAGHEAQIVLANEAVDLMSGVIADNLMPFGWPPFKEILAETVAAGVRIHV